MGKIPWWIWAVGLGGVAYILYKSVSGVTTVATSAGNAVSTGIANLWDSLPLVGIGPNQQILGNVLLPNGTLVPLSSLSQGQIRSYTDSNNNYSVYALVQGTIYQLAASNPQGNYPAALVGVAPAGA